MDYATLGATGIPVSRLGLGTAMFGATGNPDHDECARMVDRALDAGITLVDTADTYSDGEAEEIVGRALSGRRDAVVLATKFHHPIASTGHPGGNSRRAIVRAVEDSLRRLRTDWIDLYQAHRPDPTCDVDETLAALSDLVRAGKVRAIGTSTFPAAELVEAQWVAERRGRERFTVEQPPYSMLVRGVEADVLPVCQRHRIGVVCWGPLGGGWLSGAYGRGMPAPTGVRARVIPSRFDPAHRDNARKLEATEALIALAGEAGLTIAQLAIGFVLRHPALTAALAGPRTPAHLEAYLDAADVRLDDELMDRIDAIVAPGTNVNPSDVGWTPPALADAALRRR